MKFMGVLLLALSLLFLHTTPTVEAQLAETMLVREVVQELMDSAQEVIESLEGASDNTLFRARQQLELLINQLRMVADGLTDKVFNELSSAERQFFSNVRIQLDELKKLQKVTATDVERIVNSASHAVRGLPLAKTFPIVLSYKPLFVPSGGPHNQNNVRIEISGILLASHEPSLVVENNTCERTRKIDSELVFSCNKNLFVADDVVGTARGKLIVYERLGYIQWLFGIDAREYHYDISINTIPTVMGTVRPSLTTQLRKPVSETRSQSFSHRNGHCSGKRHPLFSFNTREGWKIDPISVRTQCHKSSRSSCNGLRNVTEYSFGYSCTTENRGLCGPWWKDARGSCWGSVTWEEVRVVDVLKDQTLNSVNLHWGKEEIISLPEGVRTVRIAVDKADGTRRIFTDTDTRDPWFDVEVDLEARHIVIRPESLAVAMK